MVKLRAETLLNMDRKRFASMVNHYLAIARLDCFDRPALKKPRKIVLTIQLTPKPDDQGLIAEVDVKFGGKVTLPPMESQGYGMRPSDYNEIEFMPAYPEHYRTPGLFPGDEDTVKTNQEDNDDGS
jgi:hypothetical protein